MYKCTTIVRQNITAVCKYVAVKDISIRPCKIILTEINNHIIISDLTIFDVTAIRKVFTMLVKNLFL